MADALFPAVFLICFLWSFLEGVSFQLLLDIFYFTDEADRRLD